MKTMICLILDRSGSMSGQEKDVVGGVNTFITEQQAQPNPAAIAMVRFDTERIERFRDMGDLAHCSPLRLDEYKPSGGTPLLDAVGVTLAKLDEDWKREKPDRAIVMIVTDGEENSSKEYSREKVKRMIEERENSGLWAFIYIGANVDAFAEAGSLGINLSNTANYSGTGQGVRAAYASASADISMKRFSGAMLSGTLGGNIADDGTLTTSASATSAKPDVTRTDAKWVTPTA